MTTVKEGNTVRVHYTGTLDDGSVFDTSKEKEPLEFTLGQGQIIPGFEEAVVGMKVGESKSVHIAAENAYGLHRDELVVDVPLDQLPQDLNLEVGRKLQMRQTNGQSIVVTVTGISEKEVTLDANHALAGQDLKFEIELVEIVS
jgi:peptidylprolyl isomerase